MKNEAGIKTIEVEASGRKEEYVLSRGEGELGPWERVQVGKRVIAVDGGKGFKVSIDKFSFFVIFPSLI